jgi:hypothetical protein
MRATGWKGKPLGVRVGAKNATEFFSKDWNSVRIEIEGQVRSFPLRAAFWKSCPEFRGAAIQEWLVRSGLAPWPQGSPPKLELTPLGGPLFRLTTAAQKAVRG